MLSSPIKVTVQKRVVSVPCLLPGLPTGFQYAVQAWQHPYIVVTPLEAEQAGNKEVESNGVNEGASWYSLVHTSGPPSNPLRLAKHFGQV